MKPQKQNRSEHIFILAQELLDDIELNRLSGEALLLKATRLARLVDSEQVQRWLEYELKGYNSRDELSLRFMARSGCWIDYEKKTDYWGPLAQQESAMQALEVQLKYMHLPDSVTSAPIISNFTQRMSNIVQQIQIHSAIKSKVISLLYEFVSGVYYEKAFSGLAEDIFESYKREIDAKIAENCGDVLNKLPYVYDRLREGDTEAVSQGLTTCRRIIDAFADVLYPASEETIQLEGNSLDMGSNRHQNRLNVYIAKRVSSDSRKKRLRQSLSNLYSRVSTGVHSEVLNLDTEGNS
ncbi:MAG: hypothetical protein V7K40_31220 [Nostoc sp.]|uniref:AbiTii domain-containing protein n=1 Tax=Nostoc sp. TaxID=1180 RepID=UPI002FF9CF81